MQHGPESGGHGSPIKLLRVWGPNTEGTGTVRMVEPTQATALLVSTFALDGHLLAQTPTASAAPDGTPKLAERYRNPEVAERILAGVTQGRAFSEEVQAVSLDGTRINPVTARRGRDPVTRDLIAILSEEDVTSMALLRVRQRYADRLLAGSVAEQSVRLRASEERFTLAAELAAVWDWNIPKDRSPLSPSPSALGYSADKPRAILRDRRALALVAPEDRQSLRRAVVETDHAPGDTIDHEILRLTRDGEQRWLHVKGRYLADAEGRTGQPGC